MANDSRTNAKHFGNPKGNARFGMEQFLCPLRTGCVPSEQQAHSSRDFEQVGLFVATIRDLSRPVVL